MRRINDLFKTDNWFILITLCSLFFSCEKDNPIEPIIDNNDKYLFIEMAVYTTGKLIPTDGHCWSVQVGYPLYSFDVNSKKISYYPAFPNIVSKKDLCLLGLIDGLGPDVGEGFASTIRTINTIPHEDTILNSRARKKMITISKILNDGSIEIIFMDKVVTIPIDGIYQRSERTDSITVVYPYVTQKYEYLKDLYTIRNWGYVKKEDVSTSYGFPKLNLLEYYSSK